MFRKIERKIERFLLKIIFVSLLLVAAIYFISQLQIEILLFLAISIFIVLAAIGLRKIVWSSDKYVNERGYVVEILKIVVDGRLRSGDLLLC